MKSILTVCLVFVLGHLAFSQHVQPKLVVGIVVDQMRYDYLQKFKNDFGENGFNQLLENGEVYHQMYYNYKPTYTGPGHASIFTGTTPSQHGIIANNWYNRQTQKSIYCVEDDSKDNYYSPANLKAQTIADVLKLKFQGQSKTIGIALKDRGAILPVGRSANAAYWFDAIKGKWTTSTYYNINSKVLEEFNKVNFQKAFIDENWELSHPIEEYTESREDNTIKYEAPHYNGGRVSFPYSHEKLFERLKFEALKRTPFGNQMTIDFAKHLIEKEQLGKDNITDFLSVSFSATDYIGHQFGVMSKEVHDCYIKLDVQLSGFIEFLDKNIGRDQYLLFLTADHAAGENPSYLQDQGFSAGYLDVGEIKEKVDSILDEKHGAEDWVEAFQNLNFYFNKTAMAKRNVELHQIYKAIEMEMVNLEGISALWMDGVNHSSKYLSMIKDGFRSERSGDIVLLEEANYISYGRKGSTHGSPYSYDTHVPFIVFGSNVSPKGIYEEKEITDIAKIVSSKLQLTPPDKCK